MNVPGVVPGVNVYISPKLLHRYTREQFAFDTVILPAIILFPDEEFIEVIYVFIGSSLFIPLYADTQARFLL